MWRKKNSYSIDELLAVTERCIKPKGTSNIDLSPLLAFGDKRRTLDLYLLLGRKYIATFLLAFIIATPVSWYIISVYSANFVVKAP